MEQAILIAEQKEVIKLIGTEPKMSNFYLSGGTALAAYYLRHRFSEDLDFFSFEEPDALFLKSFAEEIKNRLKASEIRFVKLYDRNQFYFKLKRNEELKVEFAKYPFKQLENPLKQDGINIDSLRDISANKLMALLDRFDPKDFVDLFFILKTTKLRDIKRNAENKFAMKIDNIFLGGELAKVKRVEALPKMIKRLAVDELKLFFADLAKEELAPEIFKN